MACQLTSEQDILEYSNMDSHSSLQRASSESSELSYQGSSRGGSALKEPVLLQSIQSVEISDYDPNVKIKLPRGGTIIQTRIGPIQFSMVPETVKDSIIMGIEVPTIYIMPTHRFDKKFCLSVAEFEFPAYFNFFVKKRKVILVCDKAGEEAVRTIFQETLLGPRDFSRFDKDFVHDYIGKPDIVKELAHFGKNPFNPSEPLTVDTLISFIIFDNQGVADLGEGITVKRQGDDKLIIMDKEKLIARMKDKVDILIDTSTSDEYVKYGLFANPVVEKENIDFSFKEKFVAQQFQPPCFGVTILGCSHGFDPKGSTSGYIIWVNGRGVMVDPPPYSTLLLRKMGVPSSFIKWVIVSHTHADHDAGTFQKILESEKIEIITTGTILDSFVRKYSAVTGFPINYIKTLFSFRPAKIGHAVKVNGAEFFFHYSLHSIPCIGFTVKILDKSIYFSGDTFYEPEGMKKMHENGVLTKERFDQLMCPKKWENTLILHEAGVPPIHTPAKVLAALPAEVKEKIKLIHVAAKDIPQDSGLSSPQTGIENTMVLIQETADERLQIIKQLNLIQNIHLFQKAQFKHIRDIFESVYVKTYKKGEIICREGELGDEFYIIKKGSIMISSDNPQHKFLRYLYEGDYFGEACFFDHFLRTANATSVQDGTQLMILQKDDFEYIFGPNEQMKEGGIMNQLFGLQENRNKSLSLISKSKFFSQLTSSQKQELELLLQPPKPFKEGSIIWNAGVVAEFAIIVASGKVKIVIPSAFKVDKEENSPMKITKRQVQQFKQRQSVPVAFIPHQFEQAQQKAKDTDHTEKAKNKNQVFIYGEGTFIGEVDSLFYKKRLNTIVEVVEDSTLVIIQADALNSFLSSNPGLQVLFKDSLIIE